jgi:hypothetical protein
MDAPRTRGAGVKSTSFGVSEAPLPHSCACHGGGGSYPGPDGPPARRRSRAQPEDTGRSRNPSAVLTRPIVIFILTTNFNGGYLTNQMKVAVCPPSAVAQDKKRLTTGVISAINSNHIRSYFFLEAIQIWYLRFL